MRSRSTVRIERMTAQFTQVAVTLDGVLSAFGLAGACGVLDALAAGIGGGGGTGSAARTGREVATSPNAPSDTTIEVMRRSNPNLLAPQ